jgi:hypothetical protein
MGRMPYEFSARLEQIEGGGPFYVSIPAAVSKAIGRRGIVPIVATVNRVAEVRASMIPCGGGRHRLRLNAATRDGAGARLGSRVAVALRVDENPVADPAPDDVVQALREAGALAAFERFPVGKQNHIVQWIERSAREPTRVKRIAMTVEVALRASEAREDRLATRPQKRRHQR